MQQRRAPGGAAAVEPDLLPTVCNLLLLFFVPSLAVYANLILGPRIFLSYHVRPTACR